MTKVSELWVTLAAAEIGVPSYLFDNHDPLERFTRMGYTEGQAQELFDTERMMHLAGIYADIQDALLQFYAPPPPLQFSDQFYLDIQAWRDIDPHTLTPEQRWQYQKLVMSAPVRWLLDKLQEWRDANTD